MGKKLKLMPILLKAFTVASFIATWYDKADDDQVITKEELAELGLGICEILDLKTDIKV